jgi:hypothetical protein
MREFYCRLFESELTVLGTKGERLAIDVVKNAAGFFHPVFTSPARLKTYSAEALPNFSVIGRPLFEATRGARFIVNPRSSPGKILFPDEIARCLESFRPTTFAILKSDTYPTQLVKALCILFTHRAQLHTARLTFVGNPANESEAYIVIGIEADGDIPRLVEEIVAAAAVTNPNLPVDVAWLDSKSAGNPLQQHLLTVEPFYKRERRSA